MFVVHWGFFLAGYARKYAWLFHEHLIYQISMHFIVISDHLKYKNLYYTQVNEAPVNKNTFFFKTLQLSFHFGSGQSLFSSCQNFSTLENPWHYTLCFDVSNVSASGKTKNQQFFCHIYSVFAGSVRELHGLFRKFRRFLMNCAVGLVRLGPNKARTTAFCSTTLSLTGSLPLKLPLCCTKVSCSRPESSERFGSKVWTNSLFY